MLIVHVLAHVQPDCVDAFCVATRINAEASIQEPGIARFDVLQREDDPTRFTLVEAYRTAGAAADHKATRHYNVWRETVEPMMAEPRTSVKYRNVTPGDDDWG